MHKTLNKLSEQNFNPEVKYFIPGKVIPTDPMKNSLENISLSQINSRCRPTLILLPAPNPTTNSFFAVIKW